MTTMNFFQYRIKNKFKFALVSCVTCTTLFGITYTLIHWDTFKDNFKSFKQLIMNKLQRKSIIDEKQEIKDVPKLEEETTLISAEEVIVNAESVNVWRNVEVVVSPDDTEKNEAIPAIETAEHEG
jgi:hypothetical protein